MTRILVLILGLGLAATASAAEPQRQITVTGLGEVSVPPDMAVVSIGVGEDAADARAALDAMNAAAAAIIARIREAGVDGADLQTGSLMLHPIYAASSRPEDSRTAGFRAETALTVRVRDLSRLGAILDATVGDGANQISGLRFDILDRDAALSEARRAAVDDARAKAALLAEAAGVGLGPLVSLTEGGASGGPVPMDMMFEARAASVPVEAGEITVSATVTMVYGIAPAE